MSGQLLTEIRRKYYLDSVALMRHSKAISSRDGVIEAALMMGTPANQEIMRNAGLLEDATALSEGGDLIISIRAVSDAVANAALAAAQALLDQRATRAAGEQWRPRSIRSAVSQQSDANLALISVSGDFAVSEARKAIRQGLHAMIFSDNVPLDDEVALKLEARTLGRLVMGPDCGTSIINGVPLAFANKVPRGVIGVVGASGTGIQEVTCLIAAGGQGISHAIGVGGRDLKAEVGGLSTLMALSALQRDAGTERIVIISKPPAAAVVDKVFAAVSRVDKPVIFCFVGGDTAYPALPNNATMTHTLKAAAEAALGSVLPVSEFDIVAAAAVLSPSRQRMMGLFCGGTLCAEAQVLLQVAGEPVTSNVPVPGVSCSNGHALPDGDQHVMTDLGDDQYTRGRPHPMIEPSIRDDVLRRALARDDVGVILVDVVIGYGAHADPAGQLAAVLTQPRGSDTAVVVASVTGTDEDPQQRTRQVGILENAGVLVANSNADAVNLGLSVLAAAADNT